MATIKLIGILLSHLPFNGFAGSRINMNVRTKASRSEGSDDSALDSSAIQVRSNSVTPAGESFVDCRSPDDALRASARARVMLEYQRTSLQMASDFLQTQQRVMLAYLQGRQFAGPPQGNVAVNTSFVRGKVETERPEHFCADVRDVREAQPLALHSNNSYQSHDGAIAGAVTSNLEIMPTLLPQVLAAAEPDYATAIETGVFSPPDVDSVAQQVGALPGVNADKLIDQLIDIVSERTGYPPEMLDPSLDLEADLGIDSIKRVEILNNFRKLLPEHMRASLEDGIERLAGVRSLQGIMEWIRTDLAASPAGREEFVQSVSSLTLATAMPVDSPTAGAATGAATTTAEHAAVSGPRGPRLYDSAMTRTASGADYAITMDRLRDLYLNDHTFDGVPVMPMAICVELMCEAASSLYPELRVAAVSDMEIPAGIVFETGTKEIIVAAEIEEATATGARVKVAICTTGKFRRTHFKAKVELVPNVVPAGVVSIPPELPPSFSMPEFKDVQEPPTATEIYQRIMFHGPLFQGITNIEGLGVNYIVSELSAKAIEKFLSRSNGENWVIDPALLDSAMQTAGVWGRHFLDVTLLPAGFKTIRLLSPLRGEQFKVIVSVPPETAGFELKCHLAVYSTQGDMLLLIEGLKGIGTKSLNRLSSKG